MTSPYTATFGGATLYPGQVTYNELNVSAAQVYQLQWPIDNNTLSNSGTLGSSLIFARIMDVNCTNASAVLQFPNTSLSASGEQCTINNTGSQPLSVSNYSGVAVATVAAGSQYVFYQTPITTSNWVAFQLGAAISVPSAAAIAGNGLTSISGLLYQNIGVVELSTSRTFSAPDATRLFVWTGGTGTWTLPLSSSINSQVNGYYVQIKNAGSGQLSLAPTGSDNINSVNSALTFNPGDSAFLAQDGAGNWYTIGYGNVSNNIFQFLLISLAGDSGNYTLSGSALNKIAYRFSGLTTGNIHIIVPNTVAQYWVDNETTGGFTLDIGVSGQVSPVSVGAGSRVITYCDGTNVVNASTGGLSVPISIAQGGTGATTAAQALTNLGGTTLGIALFEAASTAAAQGSLNVLDAGTGVSLSVALG